MKSTKDIADYTGIHISSVISNLKKATKIGLCDYITNYSKVESKEEKLKIVCSLWNSGIQNITKISEITKISKAYVIKLLKLGKENNLCNYHNGNKTSKKKVLCIEKNKIYDSIANVKCDGYQPSSVSNCCNGKKLMAHKLHWRFI